MDIISAIFAGLLVAVFVLGIVLLYLLQLPPLGAVLLGAFFFALLVINLALIMRRAR